MLPDLFNKFLKKKVSISYRVSQVKLDKSKQLFQTENMQKIWFKWCFYYHKVMKFHMPPQKFRGKYSKALKISVKVRFSILKLPLSFSFMYCMLWLWKRFGVHIEWAHILNWHNLTCLPISYHSSRIIY